MKGSTLAVAWILCGITVQAQAPSFRGHVDLVALTVVVTDGGDRFVTDLAAGELEIYEDGVRQEMAFFGDAATPLDLAILLDTSGSMASRMATVQTAAIGLLSTLRPVDRALVVDIKDDMRVIAPLGAGAAEARAAIEATTARGGTALFGGTYLTLKELSRQRRSEGGLRRQAIVVLSDGQDGSSLISYEDVMAEARRSGIAVYTISLRNPAAVQTRERSEADYAMRALAQETGARAFFPGEVSMLADVYASIAEELGAQFAVGYTPRNLQQDGAYRRISVRVTGRYGLRARTRAGYTAGSGLRASGFEH